MWKQKSYDKEKEHKLLKDGKHRMIARLLAQRNVPEEDFSTFLSADYSCLSHPHTIHDIKKAVNVFMETVKNKGRVAVCGDYDVDGIVSSTMLKELCNIFDLECDVFLPSRFKNGYGLNEKTVEDLIEEVKDIPELLIVTDCGMNNRNEIDLLKQKGIKKIIVIDHHIADEENLSNNADALVSWRISKNCGEMCACGEVFQFIRGIRWLTKKVNPVEFLTYAAMGTVADVMPIVGDNRIIVKNGLAEYSINHVMGIGLHTLLKQCKIHPSAVTQEDIAFRIAPRINAVGRMHHPDLVYRMLIERDIELTKHMVEHIETYNQERKKIQKQIEKEAKELVDSQQFSHGIMVCNEKWHTGVVGIVAAKLTEIYNKPSIVVGTMDGVWKGSGRTIDGVNIKKILDLCPDLFEKYGGHAGAVGVTLKENCLFKAPEIFDNACKTYIENKSIEVNPYKFFDAKLKPQAITPDICKNIIQLSPFCNKYNPRPLFQLTDVTVVETKYIEGDTWRLLKFKADKNGFKIPYEFKTFSPPCGSEIEGRQANIIFSFPQKTQDPSNRFFKFELDLVDIEFLKK